MDFVTNQTQDLLPFLRYSYKLEYEQRPDYNKLRFMLKKVLMNKDVVPKNHFDWSVNQGNEDQGRKPKKSRKQRSNFSISSCDIGEHEQPWPENLMADDRQ
jgi:hypothetical protein